MNNSYKPIPPRSLVLLIKEIKQEAIQEFLCQSNDEIALLITQRLKKVISHNDFYQVLVYKAILTVCPVSLHTHTLHYIQHVASVKESLLSHKQNKKIQKLLSLL